MEEDWKSRTRAFRKYFRETHVVPRPGTELMEHEKERYDELRQSILPPTLARGRNVSFDKTRETISAANHDAAEGSFPGFTPTSLPAITPTTHHAGTVETPTQSLQSRLAALQEKKRRRGPKATTPSNELKV